MKSTLVSTPWPDRADWNKVSALPCLPRRFFARPAIQVARDLIGTVLVHRRCAGMIVETEAYLGLKDRDAHAWQGRTPRTQVMFGPPGHAYVYLIYGMHECFNVVAEPEGSPGCVLIRALEPLVGLAEMKLRRPAAGSERELCSGPGRLTQAMGITRAYYGADLTDGPLTIRRRLAGARPPVMDGPRIGVRHHVDWPLRFQLSGNPYVSRT
jgi:DNA-3-methyladenine glycosylase